MANDKACGLGSHGWDEDVHILGEGTRHVVVAADDSDSRAWLAEAPRCPLLAQDNILHTGMMWVESGLEVIRTDQSGSYFMACMGGMGEVMFDGGWKRLRSGQACLLPPFVMNAFRSVPGSPWSLIWVRYLEQRDVVPLATSHSPVRGDFDYAPMKAAVEGLHAECIGGQGPALLHLWTELIHQYVLRFSQPEQSDKRLWKLWNEVEKHLAYPWTLGELSDAGHLSAEHLRRLCKKQLGRSPMQHLTFLRMKQARHLLSTSDEKIEVIARAVGYESPFTFSNTFKKWVGWRPSSLRPR
ncbi:helix-turn-helix transcriptional regulator [Verrucomicrobiaceae bacterium N1E253]|uniref:Helix-turn-helix transcriptional regulator n=2 Tax=Oceaniferula marina TaxID=2748318 RepID=A0A851GJD8_9BACT|nr:helix-turn-helix transcriptional regulator [Oceaniferula marina]